MEQLMQSYTKTDYGKAQGKQRDIHAVFIDSENAYDLIPRQEIWRCLRKMLVSEIYVKLTMEMYKNVKTRVRSVAGMTENLDVRVELH